MEASIKHILNMQFSVEKNIFFKFKTYRLKSFLFYLKLLESDMKNKAKPWSLTPRSPSFNFNNIENIFKS